MRFQCEFCQAPYVLPDERVKGKVLKIRCKKCNHIMTVKGPQKETLNIDPTLPDPKTPNPIQSKPLNSSKDLPALQTQTQPDQPSFDADTPASKESLPALQKLNSPSPQSDLSSEEQTQAGRPLPKPTEEWLEEMEKDLNRPITQKVNLKELVDPYEYVDIRPWHVRYLPYLLATLFVGGLGTLMWPQPRQDLPQFTQSKPKKSTAIIVELSPEQLKKAKEQEKEISFQKVDLTQENQKVEEKKNQDHKEQEKAKSQPPITLSKQLRPQSQLGNQDGKNTPKSSKTKGSTQISPKKKVSSKKALASSSKTKKKSKRSKKLKTVSGGLSQNEIHKVIGQNQGSLQHCYRKLRKKQPDLGGIRGRLSFTVQTNGRPLVSSIKLKRANQKNQRFENCLKSAVRRWYFPKKSSTTRVNYPVNFTPSF